MFKPVEENETFQKFFTPIRELRWFFSKRLRNWGVELEISVLRSSILTIAIVNGCRTWFPIDWLYKSLYSTFGNVSVSTIGKWQRNDHLTMFIIHFSLAVFSFSVNLSSLELASKARIVLHPWFSFMYKLFSSKQKRESHVCRMLETGSLFHLSMYSKDIRGINRQVSLQATKRWHEDEDKNEIPV